MALSSEQQQLVDMFKNVTQETDDARAVQSLQEHGWDIQAAINGFLAGGHQRTARPPRRQSATSLNRARQAAEQQRQQEQSNAVVGFIFAVFKFLFGLISMIFKPLYALLAPVEEISTSQWQRKLDQQLRAMQDSNQPTHLNVCHGALPQAIQQAKTHIQPLLVYLHSEYHSDTQEFCRSILCAPAFIAHIHSNFVFWPCTLNNQEGSRVGEILQATGYPFLGVVLIIDSQWYAIERIQGLMPLEQLLQRLDFALQEANAQLTIHRQEREERMQNQLLRQEQDQAYEEALREDRLKEARRREEAERQRREEEEKRQREYEERQREMEEARRKEQLKHQRATDFANLPAEPGEKDPDAVRIVIKMPGGERLQRRFSKQDKIMHLYHYVGGQESCEIPDDFLLCSNFPRKEYAAQAQQLVEAGLTGSAMLFVQDLTA
eukprot:comp20643_c0_seq1/m.26731 comp20643_c0_seq1/g.26731  ORF comp20643_c0_seq1/g.26731 comp20643_c0_seq1/m.26731 type:complete len:435 (-) comp20643_c0_seq1:54-1358(-)